MSSDQSRRDVQRLLLLGARAGALYPSPSAPQEQYRLGFEWLQDYGRTASVTEGLKVFRMLGWPHALPRIIREIQDRLPPLSVQASVREDNALEVLIQVAPETPIDLEWLTLKFHCLHGALDAAFALLNAPLSPAEAEPHGRTCRYLFLPKT